MATETDKTVFEFVTEDASSDQMRAIADEQDRLKDSTITLAEEWETAHDQMGVVSERSLRIYNEEASRSSKLSRVLVTDMQSMTQSFVKLETPLTRGTKGMFEYTVGARGARRASGQLRDMINALPPELQNLAESLLKNSKGMQFLGVGAAAVGAAIGGWKIGRWIDKTLGLGNAIKTVGPPLDRIREGMDTAAIAAEGLTAVNLALGASYTDLDEALEEYEKQQKKTLVQQVESFKPMNVAIRLFDLLIGEARETGEIYDTLGAINAKLGTEFTDLDKAMRTHEQWLISNRTETVNLTKSAKELNEETKKMRAERQKATESARSLFGDLTGDELQKGSGFTDQLQKMSGGLNRLFSDSFGLNAENKEKIVKSLSEMALDAGIESGQEFANAFAGTDVSSVISDAVAADFDAVTKEMRTRMMVEETDARIAGMDAEDAKRAAERLGRLVGEATGDSMVEAIKAAEEVALGSIEAIAAQAAMVRSLVTGISGGDLSSAPESVQNLFEILRREGSQKFSGGGPGGSRLSSSELAGLENLFAAGNLKEIQAALSVRQDQRTAFRSGRSTGFSLGKDTFQRENIDLQIRFLQLLEKLVEQLQDQFPPGEQTFNLSQASIAELSRTFFLSQREGTFR